MFETERPVNDPDENPHLTLVSASIEREAGRICLLCRDLGSNPFDLILVVTESVKRLLKSGDYESAMFLLRQREVNDIKCPYLDYARIVTLLLLGDQEFAEQCLSASL